MVAATTTAVAAAVAMAMMAVAVAAVVKVATDSRRFGFGSRLLSVCQWRRSRHMLSHDRPTLAPPVHRPGLTWFMRSEERGWMGMGIGMGADTMAGRKGGQ